MSVHVYRVPDVSCAHCIAAITGELGKIDGVETIDVNLETKLVTVKSADEVSDATLRAGIDDAGYDIEA